MRLVGLNNELIQPPVVAVSLKNQRRHALFVVVLPLLLLPMLHGIHRGVFTVNYVERSATISGSDMLKLTGQIIVSSGMQSIRCWVVQSPDRACDQINVEQFSKFF